MKIRLTSVPAIVSSAKDSCHQIIKICESIEKDLEMEFDTFEQKFSKVHQKFSKIYKLFWAYSVQTNKSHRDDYY